MTKEKIKTDLKEALKNKESTKISVLKMLLASIQNAEIKSMKKEEGLSEEDTMQVIKSEAKKRKDSIEAYGKAGRNDLKEKEEEELSILESYLPEEIPEEEIEKIVEQTIKETAAQSISDFGKVMGAAMGKLKGQADGNRVSPVVKKLLSDNTE